MRKFRLRMNAIISGFAEETSEGMLFKEKEALWLLRGKPNYNVIDEGIGLRDALNREIYELDIVRYKLNDTDLVRKGVVIWCKDHKCFGIFDLKSYHFTQFYIGEICLFSTDKLEIVSHLFNHPELEKEFSWING